MASITGFGGAFIRAKAPEALYGWYEKHLGLQQSEGAYALPASTQHPRVIIAFFGHDDDYVPPAQKVTSNLQVDVDRVLDRLVTEGVALDPKRDSYDFGKFGWLTDPEGNRIELWEPVAAR